MFIHLFNKLKHFSRCCSTLSLPLMLNQKKSNITLHLLIPQLLFSIPPILLLLYLRQIYLLHLQSFPLCLNPYRTLLVPHFKPMLILNISDTKSSNSKLLFSPVYLNLLSNNFIGLLNVGLLR